MSKTTTKRRVAKSGGKGAPATPRMMAKQDEGEPMDLGHDDDEDDDEESGEPMEGDEDEEKSDLSPDELRKSLGKLEALAADQTPTSRKEALLSKAMRDELESGERDELFALMGGGIDPNSLPAEVAKSMDPAENETFSKAIDVSDFLSEMHTAVSRALGSVADCVEKSQNRQHEYNVVLAKSVLDMGRTIEAQNELIKAMSARLGVIESQPVRAPKTKGLAAPIEKSFAAPQDQNQLSKSQILDLLEGMMMKSDEEGRGGIAHCGERLDMAIAKYEGSNQISKALYGEAVSFFRERQSGRAVH